MPGKSKGRTTAGEEGAQVTRGPVHQFGLGLGEEAMARLDRLRACLGAPRGRVAELALMGRGLGHLERVHEDKIVRFDALARRAGMSWNEYAHKYAEIYSRKTWPPNIADLEREERERAADVPWWKLDPTSKTGVPAVEDRPEFAGQAE